MKAWFKTFFPLYSADQGCCRGFVTKLVYFCFYNEAGGSASICHFIPEAGLPIIRIHLSIF